jgi:8-oxo-dGTP diphosphatase
MPLLRSGVILFHGERLVVHHDFTLPDGPVPDGGDPATTAVEYVRTAFGCEATLGPRSRPQPTLEVQAAGTSHLYFQATSTDRPDGARLLTREEALHVPLAPWSAAEALLRSWAGGTGAPWSPLWGEGRLAVQDPQGRPPKRSRAGAVVIRDGRILLIEYRHGPHPVYEIPGGGIERGETPEEAVLRELKEETGLTGTVGREIARVDRNIRGSHPGRYFLVDADGEPGPRPTLDLDVEDADPVWVPLADLPGLPLWPKRLGWRITRWSRFGWPDPPAVLCDSLRDLTLPCDW